MDCLLISLNAIGNKGTQNALETIQLMGIIVPCNWKQGNILFFIQRQKQMSIEEGTFTFELNSYWYPLYIKALSFRNQSIYRYSLWTDCLLTFNLYEVDNLTICNWKQGITYCICKQYN